MDTVNIFAKDLRGKIKKDAPIEGAWVEFYDDITVGTISLAQSAKSGDIEQALNLLVTEIADWNFADEEGQLPITIESLKRLPLKIITWLVNSMEEILTTEEDSKKKASVKPS